ncbi:hypothetical protein [Wolbachia endosymbiont of Nilaparvata lugens]|uniref:hypothetical protein n=1 Tax=Wolbachia endosymbiont of Nilaparvata lugens TaxID=357143 RepID=UPI001F5006AC|nr:hypothetical protein [Wolbachia endosymbiont of Nilaparvata lugens]
MRSRTGSKVNKSKLIHDKCGKDLKCKIDDRTMNELKKCFKFEIDDKTKNDLKESIKNELEKSLKFEIGNDTKKELKDSIKAEIEKEEVYFSEGESMAFPHYSDSNDLI